MKENLIEIAKEIEKAQKKLVEREGEDLEVLISKCYESTPFALGHIIGMRDCLTMLTKILVEASQDDLD
jgi:hypothetical protein